MPARTAFSYAIVRVVPHVEREEFLNAGAVLFCPGLAYLAARIELDEARLRALAPGADVDLIVRHLAAIPCICAGGADAGPVGELPLRERWQWLVAPRSTVLQVSPAHVGLSANPAEELARLVAQMVRTKT